MKRQPIGIQPILNALMCTSIIASLLPGCASQSATPGYGAQVPAPHGQQHIRAPGFGAFQEFAIPNCNNCQPLNMALGDDGRVWFANLVGGTVDAIDTAGNVDVHAVDLKNHLLNFDVAQGTHHIWFTATNPNNGQGAIGHLAMGKVTLYPVIFQPLYITRGFEDMWFGGGPQIDKISESGAITSFALNANSNVEGLVRGPDGNIWFTDEFSGTGASRVGRIRPVHGKVTEFIVPDVHPDIISITVGPDGNLWFTDGNLIGSCTVGGAIALYQIPTQNELAYAITDGPAGDLYFTETDSIGRVTLNPVTITEYKVPFADANPTGIALGADNNIWFTIPQTGNIGRFSTH